MPNQKADTPLNAEDRDLAAEIEALAKLLADQGLLDGVQESKARGEMLAITRLMPGMTSAQWKKIVHQHPALGRWMALPLARNAFPMVTHLQQRLNELSYLTEHDPLTGLLNRRGFHHALEREMQRARREGFHMSLAMLDLDDFKQVNDTYGHACGDLVLQGLARSLEKNKRSYDQAARLGGEEFALLLPSAGPNKAKTIITRLLAAFSAITFTCDQAEPFNVTFSAGVSHMRGKTAVAPMNLIAMADDALYEAKRKGKKNVFLSRGPAKDAAGKRTMVHSDEKRFLFSGSETP